MPRDTADNKAGLRELDPDIQAREIPRDLRARLAELPSAHPSATGYVSARASGLPTHLSPQLDNRAATAHDPRGRERPGIDLPHIVAAPEYAWAGDIRMTADRRVHILEGDHRGGGGHRHGEGQPGKTEFPAMWDDHHVIDAVLAVARKPDQAPERQNWNGRWLVNGKHDGVEITAIVESDGQVWTAWPREGSPGVVKNAVEETSDGRT